MEVCAQERRPNDGPRPQCILDVVDSLDMDASRFNLGQRVTYGFATWIGAALMISTLASIWLPALVISAAAYIGWRFSDTGFQGQVRPHLLRARHLAGIIFELFKGFPTSTWTMLKQLAAVWQMRERQMMTLPDDFDDAPLTIPKNTMPAPSAPDNSRPPMVSRPMPALAAAVKVPAPKAEKSTPEKSTPQRADDPNPWAPPAPSMQGRRVGYRPDGSSFVY